MPYVILVAYLAEVSPHAYYSMLGHIPQSLFLSLIALLAATPGVVVLPWS